MKLIFTELGNPELCMNITVSIPKALAEELLRVCRTAFLGNRGMGKAHSGTSALSETLPAQCDLSWPSMSKAVGLGGLLSSFPA